NCAWWILADLAIFMAGHVTVPIYPTLGHKTVKYILEHSESKAVFIGKLDVYDGMKDGISADLPQISFPLCPEGDFQAWDDIVQKTEPIKEFAERTAEEMGTIVYTSGSTGTPKGVMLSFGAMTEASEAISKVLSTGPKDRVLSYLPLSHVFERFVIEMAGIAAGVQIFFAESLDTFVNDLNRAKPTLFVSVPRLWLKFQLGVFKKMPPKKLAFLLKIPILKNVIRKKVLSGLGLECVRFAGSGSAPIPGALIEWYQSLGLELLEGYGMSENFAYSHISKPGQVRVGYVGSTYPGVECKISEEGEILVKSPGSMLGYFKEPEKTKASFTEDGFLKTGDRGEIDDMGRLRITGRVKELFKTSKGKYIAPAPIENKLVDHPLLETCCVMGSGHPQPYALAQLSEDARAKASSGGTGDIEGQLATKLDTVNASLPGYEKLAFVCLVKDDWTIENGYLTPTMKLKRNLVEDKYGPNEEAWYEAKKAVIFE
ncbi:MAG: AMP-binding protein, partial [Planctomycetota bacterium]